MNIDIEHLVHLLTEASHEIRDLRQRNELMAAKLDVYETFKRMVVGPSEPRGMSPDIRFQIEAEILRLEKEIARRPVPAP